MGGAPHASTSVRTTALAGARTCCGCLSPAPTRAPRSGPGPVRDLAWAVGGVGQAYDHEAPLGVPVVYTATPQYQDGTWGAPTALGITVRRRCPRRPRTCG
ncbi:hypothetical protein D3C59_34900 [Streptomyces sp. SHP22-7]|nr:hypothetical protein D3C59_34900 [Streptomyces sp. SHP22-7]